MIAFMGLKFMYVSTVNKFLNSCNNYDYVKDINDFIHGQIIITSATVKKIDFISTEV